MANEVLGDLGYLGIIKEVTPGTALTPNAFVLLYDETLSTPINLVESKPIVGNKFARYRILQGQRQHTGDFTIQAEPNTGAQVFDMLLTRGAVTGTGPYTWPFTLGTTVPNSYTIDVSTGNDVHRYSGFQASDIAVSFQGNEMRYKVKGTALKAFHGAEILSVATSTVTLKTDGYDLNPTTNLVVGDLVACWKASDGSKQNFTISSLTPTTVTLSGSPTGITAGDMLILRPAVAAYDLSTTPFLWARTEFRYSLVNAAAALTATHTPVEQGATFNITHNFKDAAGEKRSGSFDPAAVARTTGDVGIKVSKFFQNPDEAKTFLGIRKSALVIRSFSGSANEFRLTLNDIRIKTGGDKPLVKVGAIEYYALDYAPSYDATDQQAWDVKFINGLAAT